MKRQTLRNLVLIWLAWSVILIGYMHLAPQRYAPQRPDDALVWTAGETNARSLSGKPYLLEPTLNTQVAWDSEFYLSVATLGYDDPDIALVEADGTAYATSYAFFPFYPYVMKVLRLPFVAAGIEPIAASVMAGLLISLLGTLAAMIALYDMVRDHMDDADSIRTVFTMLIFPTSMFFAVVYTEGLFAGLAFSSLALMRRKHLIAAALLAALATWTRAIGAVLLAPLLLSWLLALRNAENRRALLLQLPLMLLPVAAYGAWRAAFGTPFDFVQDNWFGNQLFQLELTLSAWEQILQRASEYPETAVVVALGIGSVALALLSCVVTARRYPRLALFGLLALLIPLTGGWTGTQSAFRYVLIVPTLWIMLGQLSRNVVFEKAWILASILLLAMQAYLFAFDFWVA